MTLAGQVLDAAAVVAGWRTSPPPPLPRRRPSRLARRADERVAEPKRSPPTGAARAGAANTSSPRAAVAEQRTARARTTAPRFGRVPLVGCGAARVARTSPPTATARFRTRDERRELGHRGDLHPVGEALFPDVGVALDLAALDAAAHVGVGDRTDLLTFDDDVPAASFGRGAAPPLLRPRSFAATHHNDMAALLAADLEDLASNLVVGNRVLGPARITNDLHQRLDLGIRAGTTALTHCLPGKERPLY